MAEYIKSIMVAIKGLVQTNLQGYTKDFLLFDSWLSSKRATDTVMNIGAYIVGMV